MRLRIKNWKTYQHYDHRCPPWIKLHFRMLSSRDWVCASDCKRVLAIACMLIASQDEAKDGSFEADPEYFQRVAYLSETPDFNALLESGFLEMLADASGCKQKIQNGGTEKETEREKETEGRDEFTKLEYARWFWEQLSLPHTRETLIVVADAIELYASSTHHLMRDVAELVVSRAKKARDAGKTINKFWFMDGHHLKDGSSNPDQAEWLEREKRILAEMKEK